jgi:hypothetical protein
MSSIRSLLSSVALLLGDERSAVRPRAATVATLVVLGTVATGLLLISLSEGLYERRAHGRLMACDGAIMASMPRA